MINAKEAYVMNKLYAILLVISSIGAVLLALEPLEGFRRINTITNDSNEDVFIVTRPQTTKVWRILSQEGAQPFRDVIFPETEDPNALEHWRIQATEGDIYPAGAAWIINKQPEKKIALYLPKDAEAYIATKNGIMPLPNGNIDELVITREGQVSLK
jgi:hypothetical protein